MAVDIVSGEFVAVATVVTEIAARITLGALFPVDDLSV
jgi:hypothetical protein